VGLNFNLVMFLRHYSLKRPVIRAGDVKKGRADIPGEPEQGTEGKWASEPMNDNSGEDIRTVTVVDADQGGTGI
jgi:hypothetical protein